MKTKDDFPYFTTASASVSLTPRKTQESMRILEVSSAIARSPTGFAPASSARKLRVTTGSLPTAAARFRAFSAARRNAGSAKRAKFGGEEGVTLLMVRRFLDDRRDEVEAS